MHIGEMVLNATYLVSQEQEGAFKDVVSALAEIGEKDRARFLCEKLLGYASPLLLYAEELDPRTGRHLGNFPQAFTHLALINAVMHVIRMEEQDGTDGDGRVRTSR